MSEYTFQPKTNSNYGHIVGGIKTSGVQSPKENLNEKLNQTLSTIDRSDQHFSTLAVETLLRSTNYSKSTQQAINSKVQTIEREI